MTPSITIDQTADFIIAYSAEHGDIMTHLKLQKLVYYAQAWHLALHDGQPLFEADFEAWTHGPVNRGLYKRFKGYKWNPLADVVSEVPELPVDAEAHLIEILRVFGGFSAFQLEDMVHQELPWLKARGNVPADAPGNNRISRRDMQKFYSELAAAA